MKNSTELTLAATTFSVARYFDPFGDGKSTRKVFDRKFFHSEIPKEKLMLFFADMNSRKTYYNQLLVVFKEYTKTTDFELSKKYYY